MLSTQHLKSTVVLVLALGALSALIAPAANAQLVPGDPPCTSCTYNPTTGAPSNAAPATIVRVAAPSGGFDWTDAGIGAAGILAVALVVLGLTLAVRTSRSTPARETSTSSRARGM